MTHRVIPVDGGIAGGRPVQVPTVLAAQIATVCQSMLEQVLPQFANQLGGQLLEKVRQMIAEATGEAEIAPERLAVGADGSDPIPGIEYIDEAHGTGGERVAG